ncbi:hypothetical protein Plim_3575 [Planctopirus limnophila DSM 3776]|uniref:Uncharacterized protein n=1 Tax=Planctopirus limnophila (strain ATCC 43296 / DSM 3776 / IFAM 1008 / Mu 290) TaxID=521674 RepID=D5SVM8_PLAL2|nr:hypothetical protein Plim_3575 [Planctopirus limnophila DSM 3776]
MEGLLTGLGVLACRKPDLRGVAKLPDAGPPWDHREAPHAELTQQCQAESLRFQVFRNSLVRVHRGSGVESAKRNRFWNYFESANEISANANMSRSKLSTASFFESQAIEPLSKGI